MTDYTRTRDFNSGLMGMAVVNDDGESSAKLHCGDARGVQISGIARPGDALYKRV